MKLIKICICNHSLRTDSLKILVKKSTLKGFNSGSIFFCGSFNLTFTSLCFDFAQCPGHVYRVGDGEPSGHLKAVHRGPHRLYRRGDPAERHGHLLLDTLHLQRHRQGLISPRQLFTSKCSNDTPWLKSIFLTLILIRTDIALFCLL